MEKYTYWLLLSAMDAAVAVAFYPLCRKRKVNHRGSSLLSCSRYHRGKFQVCCRAANLNRRKIMFAATQQTPIRRSSCLLSRSKPQPGRDHVCCTVADTVPEPGFAASGSNRKVKVKEQNNLYYSPF